MARDKVFISYSHRDKPWLDALRVHLVPLQEQGLLDVWDDTRIRPGSPWRADITRALESAKVAVLLVSPDFLVSPFISQEELPRLLRANQDEGLSLLCFFVRPSVAMMREYTFLDDAGSTRVFRLSDVQGANDPNRALSTLRGSAREAALVRLSETILDAATAAPRPSRTESDPRAYLEKVIAEHS